MSQKNLPILALKLLLSGGLILWITRDVALDSVFAVIESANLALLGLAFSLFFVGYIISAFRWRTLMRAQGGNAPILYLIRSFMVALFFALHLLVFRCFTSPGQRRGEPETRRPPGIVWMRGGRLRQQR